MMMFNQEAPHLRGFLLLLLKKIMERSFGADLEAFICQFARQGIGGNHKKSSK